MRPMLLSLLMLALPCLPMQALAEENQGEVAAQVSSESLPEQAQLEDGQPAKQADSPQPKRTKNSNEQNIDAQSFVRDVGYRVGDVVSQRVEVVTPAGYELDEASLPKRLGAGAHIELRNVAQKSSRIDAGIQHTLTFEWQVFRTLRDVRPIPLRALELRFRHGNEVLVANVQAAEILMAPMLPTMLTPEQATPRAAIAPQPQDLQPYWWQLLAAFLALMVAALYFAWRFDLLPAWMTGQQAARPFRKAAREIRQQARKNKGADKAAQGAGLQASMRILSRAFNDYAGKAVTVESLEAFFQAYPEMRSLQRDIAQFYAATQQVFFAGNTDAMQQPDVARLARQLSLLETL